jgi:hypothetical protein
MIPTRLRVLELWPAGAALEESEHTLFGPALRAVAGGARSMTGDTSCGLLPRRRARHRYLPAPEVLDDTHGSAAAGAWLTQGERSFGLWFRHGDLRRRWTQSKARILVMLALRVELASRPGCRMRWKPSGKTWIRNLRMNTDAASSMTFFRSPRLTL